MAPKLPFYIRDIRNDHIHTDTTNNLQIRNFVDDYKVIIKSTLSRGVLPILEDQYLVHRDKAVLESAPLIMSSSTVRFDTKLISVRTGDMLYQSIKPVLWHTLFLHEKYQVPVLQVELALMMAIRCRTHAITVTSSDFIIHNQLRLPESVSPIQIDWFITNRIAFVIKGPDHSDPTPMSEADALGFLAKMINAGPIIYGDCMYPLARQLRRLPKNKSLTFRGNLITKVVP